MTRKIIGAAVGAAAFTFGAWSAMALGLVGPTEWSETRFLVFAGLLFFSARVIGVVVDHGGEQ